MKALTNNGSSSEISLVIREVTAVGGDDLTNSFTVVNGTFSTLDEVAPTIDITTPTTVSSTFNVAGTIHDVGGMGTAIAYVDNGTVNKTVDLMPLTQTAPDTWTFDTGVTWPVYGPVTIKVSATDAAGNSNTVSEPVQISEVGFSNPEPTGDINAQPEKIRVFTNKMEPSTVTLTLTSPDSVEIPLGVTFNGGYAENTSVPALADGTWTVTARGNDTISGATHSCSWTFTLDTVPPVINFFSITDTDTDGYLEAGERLNFSWDVSGAGVVLLMDNDTHEVFFNSTALTGTNHTTIDVGNRNMVFAAFDEAGNGAYVPFHLYYNYMAWINSTRIGTVSGIDTNLSAVRQLDLTAQGRVEFFNARSVPSVPIGTVKRTTTEIGWVTNDTYVKVDNTANATYTGADTYDCVWTYTPCSDLDFLVQAPDINAANLVILEANESYLAQLAKEGTSARENISYSDLVQKCAWIFIDGGYTKITIDPDGTPVQDPTQSDGRAVKLVNNNIIDTLSDADNQVNLTAGYRLGTQTYNGTTLQAITLPAGDYALAAISMDGDRIGVITGMPFTVMESDDAGAVPVSVVRGTPFTAGFATDCDRIGAVVIRHDTWNADVRLNATTLNRDPLSVNLTYNNVPATQHLYHNIYVSPDAAAYAHATNASSVSVPTENLRAGIYDVYMVAACEENATVKCYGHHQITVQHPAAPVANFTADPMTGFAPLNVDFTDMSTGNVDQWYWEFGDGEHCWNQKPSLHTYENPGTYQVNLTVWVYDQHDTISKEIVVTSPVPVANFTASPMTGYAPLTVTFTDLSTGNITTRLWNFGDGTTCTTATTHTFSSAGTYAVKLTVAGPDGSSNTTRTITVKKKSSGGGGGGGGGGGSHTISPTQPTGPSGTGLWAAFSLTGASFTTTDGVQTFSIDLDKAERVKVEGDTVTFTKNGVVFEIKVSDLKKSGDILTGTVTSVKIKSGLIEGSDNMSARFTAEFPYFPVNATIGANLIENVSEHVASAYSLALLDEGLDVSEIAYTLKVTRHGIEKCGAAKITMTVSPGWVTARGGVDKIRILRQADDGTTQVLETRFVGYDTDGHYVFEADSPDGLSEIGLVAVTESGVTVQPTDVGVGAETPTTLPAGETPAGEGLPVGVIAVLLVAIVAIAAFGYFYMQKKE